jgi:hypothetical protein
MPHQDSKCREHMIAGEQERRAEVVAGHNDAESDDFAGAVGHCSDLVILAQNLGQSVVVSTPKPEKARSHELLPPHSSAGTYGTLWEASHHLRFGISDAADCPADTDVWLYQRPMRIPRAIQPKIHSMELQIMRSLTQTSVSVFMTIYHYVPRILTKSQG